MRANWENIQNLKLLAKLVYLKISESNFILHRCKLTNLLVIFFLSLMKAFMTTITHDPNWVVWISFCSERESDSAWVALHCSPLYTEAKYSASGCKRMRSWCRIVRWFCRRLWRQKLSSKCFVLDYISGDQDLHVSIQYLTAITWIPCGALRHFKIIVLFFFAFNNSITFLFLIKNC